MRIGAHLSIKDNVGAYGDDIFKAEARPGLPGEASNIASVRQCKQFIEIGARSYGNQWLMADHHQNTPRPNAGELLLDFVYPGTNPRDQLVRQARLAGRLANL